LTITPAPSAFGDESTASPLHENRHNPLRKAEYGILARFLLYSALNHKGAIRKKM
jgi:hypothetical protein